MTQFVPSSLARGKARQGRHPSIEFNTIGQEGTLPWRAARTGRRHLNPRHLPLAGLTSACKAEAHTEPRRDAASKPEQTARLACATPRLSTS